MVTGSEGKGPPGRDHELPGPQRTNPRGPRGCRGEGSTAKLAETWVRAPPRRSARPHPQASARARAGGLWSSARGVGHNGKWAEAAVTRHGCRRGVLRGVSASRGCSARTGTPVPRLRGQKRGEPHDRLRGATDPWRPNGESRQGGEEPRRRNETRRLAASGRRGLRSPGVDIRCVCRWRGVE
jgi:hypothetical protein